MNLDKFKENVESADVVEELIALSQTVFSKCNDDVKTVVKTLVSKAYLMGKLNHAKIVSDD